MLKRWFPSFKSQGDEKKRGKIFTAKPACGPAHAGLGAGFLGGCPGIGAGLCRLDCRPPRPPARLSRRPKPARMPVSSGTGPATTPACAGPCAGSLGLQAGPQPGLCRPPCRFARGHIRGCDPVLHPNSFLPPRAPFSIVGSSSSWCSSSSPHTSSPPLLSKLQI